MTEPSAAYDSTAVARRLRGDSIARIRRRVVAQGELEALPTIEFARIRRRVVAQGELEALPTIVLTVLERALDRDLAEIGRFIDHHFKTRRHPS